MAISVDVHRPIDVHWQFIFAKTVIFAGSIAGTANMIMRPIRAQTTRTKTIEIII
jgi:hypothetical protein